MNKKLVIILVTVVVLLVITNVFTVYYLINRNDTTKIVTQDKVEDNNMVEEQIIDADGDGLTDDEEKTYGTDINMVDTDGDGFTDKEEIDGGYDPLIDQTNEDKEESVLDIDLTEGEIIISWNEWPSPVAYNKFFGFQDFKISEDEKRYLDSIEVYLVGEINQGVYESNNLYVIKYPTWDMGGYDQLMRVIKTDEKFIILEKHSGEIFGGQYWGEYENLLSWNENIIIKNLGGPKNIEVPNSDLVLLELTDLKQSEMMSDHSNVEKLFEYSDNNYVYKNKNGSCFFIGLQDGTSRDYNFELDYIGEEGEVGHYGLHVPNTLNFNYLDGTKNKREFITQSSGGCGFVGVCYNYVNYISIDDLDIIGDYNGDYFYELKDSNFKKDNEQNSLLGDMYEWYYPGYDSEAKQTIEKISFEEFVDDYPIIYWQDPFGHFIEFRNAKYLPAAECGKPVIYLYPEEEQDVSVWVEPTGGFTITEPAYNNGWKVRADQESNLYNYADQTVYPYLFWEGYGENYTLPQQGFVIDKENVERFLEEKLAELGLIEKEYDEFIEFWLPRMQESPYYYIAFTPQAEFDKIAPLTVEPKPDTVIRVFMDYKELDRPINVVEPKIFTPERKGFTVVEWGGALHR